MLFLFEKGPEVVAGEWKFWFCVNIWRREQDYYSKRVTGLPGIGVEWSCRKVVAANHLR